MNELIKGFNLVHLHTDLSNVTTNIDSVTKYNEYIDHIKENRKEMTGIAFTEHGNIFSWYSKKKACESAGLKYVHAVECYLTATLEEKKRDNYHILLYAKNFEGFKELNELVSNSHNRSDGHFYYAPRITLDELLNTSDNIIISTACIGGIFKDDAIVDIVVDFLAKNKHRTFLEIQPHDTEEQIYHNSACILPTHRLHNIPLILGTDTHCLNEKHKMGRTMLQQAKNVFFDNEEGWNVVLPTVEDVYSVLSKQEEFFDYEIVEAFQNTYNLVDMCEDYEINLDYKYPKLHQDGLQVLKNAIMKGIKDKGIDKLPNYNEYIERIKIELKAFEHNKAIDYLLLDKELKDKAREKGIFAGVSRGSVAGSVIAYLIGITEIDSIKRNLNFERFMNTARVSLADIDTDWSPSERDTVKDLLYDMDNVECCDIITFNTIQTKGAIREIGRALKMDLALIGQISESSDDEKKIAVYKNQYPTLFEYVDIVIDTIVSSGSHPCGVVVSPIDIDTNIGTCTLATSKNKISLLNMQEIDSLFFVKLDILGLDNLEIINKTCKLANISRLQADTIDLKDEKVWRSIQSDTLGIFQWTSKSATDYISKLFSLEVIENIKKEYNKYNIEFEYIDLFSVGNGAIRPAGESYRESLSKGIFYDNKNDEINKFLSKTLGYLVYQEQIIDFLVVFCGYAKGEADIIRRAIAKKKGSEQYLEEIEIRYIQTMVDNGKMDTEKAKETIKVFIKVILDASDYLFSLNHSDAYSHIGYMCGYLREYYTIEFLTTTLNVVNGDLEKTNKAVMYAKKKGIEINSPLFGKSKGEYFCDKENNQIYKGIGSIKYLNKEIADKLYDISLNANYNNFIDLLVILKEDKSIKITNKHIEILIKLDYFSEFGNINHLLKYFNLFNDFYGKKQFRKEQYNQRQIELLRKYSKTETEKVIKDINTIGFLTELFNTYKELESPNIKYHKLQYELLYLDGINTIDNTIKENYLVVLECKRYSNKVYCTVYQPSTGETNRIRVNIELILEDKELEVGAIIYAYSIMKVKKKRRVGNTWIETNDYNYDLMNYELIAKGVK